MGYYFLPAWNHMDVLTILLLYRLHYVKIMIIACSTPLLINFSIIPKVMVLTREKLRHPDQSN